MSCVIGTPAPFSSKLTFSLTFITYVLSEALLVVFNNPCQIQFQLRFLFC